MILQLANLTPDGVKFSGEDPVEVFIWEEGANDIIRPSGPLRWNFTASLFGTELLINGKLSAEFSGYCARCGIDMTLTVEEPVCFSVEVSENFAEVDLTSEFRDAILLALPNHPICRADCEGVCPSCGKRISEGVCSCQETSQGSPWDVLDNL